MVVVSLLLRGLVLQQVLLLWDLMVLLFKQVVLLLVLQQMLTLRRIHKQVLVLLLLKRRLRQQLTGMHEQQLLRVFAMEIRLQRVTLPLLLFLHLPQQLLVLK